MFLMDYSINLSDILMIMVDAFTVTPLSYTANLSQVEPTVHGQVSEDDRVVMQKRVKCTEYRSKEPVLIWPLAVEGADFFFIQ